MARIHCYRDTKASLTAIATRSIVAGLIPLIGSLAACATGEDLARADNVMATQLGDQAGELAPDDATGNATWQEDVPADPSGADPHADDTSVDTWSDPDGDDPPAIDPYEDAFAGDAGGAPVDPGEQPVDPIDDTTVPIVEPVIDDVNRCPGSPIDLAGTTPAGVATASTTNLTNEHDSPTCNLLAGGVEAVYRFTAPVDGWVTVTLAPNGYAGMLYVREGDCGAGPEIACVKPGLLNLTATADIEVTAGTEYFVFADQDHGLTQGTLALSVAY